MINQKKEKTCVIIKPDGVRKGLMGEIIKRFEQRDLKVIALKMFMPTVEQIDKHYPKDKKWIIELGEKTANTYEEYGYNLADLGTTNLFEIGKKVRSWTIDYMVSSSLVKMIVQGVHAVDVVRKICGDTMPYKADMGTIRGDFSIDSPVLASKEMRAIMNLVHTSKTPEEAIYEIKLWFDEKEMVDYKRHGVD